MKQYEGSLIDKEDLVTWTISNVPNLIERLMEAEEFLRIANDTYVPEEQTELHSAISNFLSD